MFRILPLASSLHPADQVRKTTERLTALLAGQAVPHRLADPPSANALLVLTGGTERLALQALEGRADPALLLAHPDQNSLPAALEILCRLQQEGRRGRIVLLREDGAEAEGLARVARHLGVRDRLSGLRLGRIGAPSEWLVGSMPETGLLTQVWGPQVVDVPMEALKDAMASAKASEVAALDRDFRQGACGIREPSDQDLGLAARVAAGLRQVVRDQHLDACTVRCFDLVQDLGTTGCLALSWLLDEGLVAGCEGDLPAAMTMLWLQALTGQTSFMANPQDLDTGTNTLWLAHCTIARRMTRRYTLRSHFESSLGVGLQGELEPGECTLARLGGRDLRGLFVSDGELLENGTSELRCRTQVRVRLAENVGRLLAAPLGNHHVLVRGHWAAELKTYHALFV